MVSRSFRRNAIGGRLLTAAACLFLLQGPRAVAEESSTSVTVHEEKGVYRVLATFMVDQTPPVVLAVLTDYEQIPRFMPGIRTSIVRERGAGWAVVEQEAESRMMLFSKRLHLVLRSTNCPTR